MQRRGVLCREDAVIRKNSEHAISALSKAVPQAGTKNHIHEKAPKHSSASMSATGTASRLAKGRLDRYADQLLTWYEGKPDGYMTYSTS